MRKGHTNIIYKVAFAFYKKINASVVNKGNLLSMIYIFVKRRFLFRISNIYLPVFLLKGKEKHSNKDITVVYCGDNHSFYFIADILFEAKYEKEYLGNYLITSLPKILSKNFQDSDITILKTDRFFSRFLKKKSFFLIPAWINMKLDISKPFDDIVHKFKKSAKEDVRKIKKFNYTYELTNELEEFDRFFHEIRDPHFQRRVGKQAIPGTTSYSELKVGFQLGSLLKIKDGDQTIAGFIIVHNDHMAHPHFMGIKVDKELYKAAGSALFYFFIKWAKENNISLLNFGMTRPFLNNGPFRFKRKWSMTAEMTKKWFDVFAFKVNPHCSEAIESFFEHNPFLLLENKALTGIVFSPNSLSPEEQKRFNKRYYTDGITSLNIIQTKEQLISFLKRPKLKSRKITFSFFSEV